MLALLLLALLTSTNASSQSLALVDVNTTGFPDLEGSVILFDPAGEPTTPLLASDLQLSEDGVPRTILSISCPDPTDPEPLSVVLVIDRSGSMVAPLPNGGLPIDMVTEGVDAFLQTLLFAPPTSVALTAFNEDAFLLSDFRTNAPPLQAALSGLAAFGGTTYDPPFLDPLNGALDLLKTRSDTVRRIVIFITDGEPEIPPSTNAIIGAANVARSEIYAVTIGSRITPELALIARRTGGKGWGSVQTSEQLTGLLRSIALISRGISPCKITWKSDLTCGPGPVFRDAILRHNPTGTATNNIYRLPERSLINLATSKRVLYFGKTTFPNISELSVTITARNGSFVVGGEEFSDPDHFSLQSWGGAPPPFTLEDGESRELRIRFTPKDTSSYASDFRLLGDPCASRTVLLAGGDRVDSTASPLVLRSPIGGESYNACDSISITWAGVEPEVPVRVQFSRDDGKNWRTISDSATGYEFRWMPPAPDSSYRIRISTDAAEQHLIRTIAGGGQLDEDSIFAVDAALSFPMGLDTRDGFLYFAENGKHRVRTLNLESGVISTFAGTGFNGNGGDGGPGPLARLNAPTDIYVEGDTAFVTEYPRVRALDTGTGVISTYAGNIFRDWAPDGTHMAGTGSLMIPFSIVADDEYIYVTELDSHRIRRINRTTRIISTIAGGGGTGGFDSDGRPATDAYLLLPKGLALRDSLLYVAEEIGHRIRVINLNTGIINTVAGDGSIGDGGDGGPARNAQLNGPIDIELWGDSLLIADRYANRIRIVDLKSQMIGSFAGVGGPGGFSGDDGPARNARFDSPAGLTRQGDLLYVSDRFNNRVREITLYRPDGLDSSASSFTVAAPSIALGSNLILFDETPEGGRRDSVLTAFLCNRGNVPMTLDSAVVEGAHPDDFVVTGGVTTVIIPPGECRTISVAFTPSGPGDRNAELILFGSCTVPDTLQLQGTARADCGLASLSFVQIDSIVFGVDTDGRDTTVTGLLCNNGGTSVSGSFALDSPDGAYGLIASNTRFSLDPGECLSIPIRFNPSFPGRSMALLTYDVEGGCRAESTVLSSHALRPGELSLATLIMDSLVCPDEIATALLNLTNHGGQTISVTDISFALNDEGFSITSTLPSTGSPMILQPDETRQIEVELAPTSAGEKNARLVVTSDDPAGDREVLIKGWQDSLRVAPVEPVVTVRRDGSRSYPRDTVIRFVNTGDRTVEISGLDLAGSDQIFFTLDLSFFPVNVGPGDTVEIPVSLLEPTEDRPYRTTFTPVVTMPCPSPVEGVEIVHSGSGPLLRITPMDFGVIRCDQPEMIDSVIRLTNDGGLPLEISTLSIVNDNGSSFEVLTSGPLTIAPGRFVDVTVRYRPSGPGTHMANLRIVANTENGVEDIPLRGERASVSFTSDRTSITFNPAGAPPIEETFTLTNNGTLPITWDLTTISGPYEVVSVVPATAPPNRVSVVTLRYLVGSPGNTDGSLTVREDNCGIELAITLNATNEAATIELSLPIDSALVNDRVRLPVRYRLLGGAAPLPSDSFQVQVSFIATTFFYDEVTGAAETERLWDPVSEVMQVTVKGEFSDLRGDTLFDLGGLALNGRFEETPLTFGPVVWSRPGVAIETLDGNFSLLGLCLNEGLHLEVRGPVLRAVTPQPAGTTLTARIELPDWTSLRGFLVDGNGRRRIIYETDYLPEGVFDLKVDLQEFSAGAYLLVIESPHGSSAAMVIVR